MEIEIDTVLRTTQGNSLGTSNFPAVPSVGQVVEHNGVRYVIERIEWYAGKYTRMGLIVHD